MEATAPLFIDLDQPETTELSQLESLAKQYERCRFIDLHAPPAERTATRKAADVAEHALFFALVKVAQFHAHGIAYHADPKTGEVFREKSTFRDTRVLNKAGWMTAAGDRHESRSLTRRIRLRGGSPRDGG